MDKYPSWRYKEGEKPRIVTTPEEDDALGTGWFHSPTLQPDAEGAGADAPAVVSAPVAVAGYTHQHWPKYVFYRAKDGAVVSVLCKTIEDANAKETELGTELFESPEELPKPKAAKAVSGADAKAVEARMQGEVDMALEEVEVVNKQLAESQAELAKLRAAHDELAAENFKLKDVDKKKK